MRSLKFGVAFIGALALIFIARIWWASIPPKLPQNLPTNSIWLEAPTRLNFSPSGFWVGCWLDGERHANRCSFADFKGKVLYESDYLSCDGRPPIPDNKLRLKSDHQSSFLIRLEDGTVLVQADGCPRKTPADAP